MTDIVVRDPRYGEMDTRMQREDTMQFITEDAKQCQDCILGGKSPCKLNTYKTWGKFILEEIDNQKLYTLTYNEKWIVDAAKHAVYCVCGTRMQQGLLAIREIKEAEKMGSREMHGTFFMICEDKKN